MTTTTTTVTRVISQAVANYAYEITRAYNRERDYALFGDQVIIRRFSRGDKRSVIIKAAEIAESHEDLQSLPLNIHSPLNAHVHTHIQSRAAAAAAVAVAVSYASVVNNSRKSD